MDEKFKELYIYYFTVVGTTACFIFGLYNIFIERAVILGLIEMAVSAGGLLTLLYLSTTKKVDRASSVVLLLVYAVSAVLVYTGGIAYTGIAWVFTIPLLAFGMKKIKEAIIWICNLIIIIVVAWSLPLLLGSESTYDWPTIRQVLAILIAISFLAYIDKRIQDKYELTIKSQIKEIEEDNKKIVIKDKELESYDEEVKIYKMAFENSSDIIVICDPNGLVKHVNRAVEKITGFKAAELIGQKAGHKWGGLMEQSYYKNMWDIIRNQKKSFDGVITNKKANGEKYTASIHIDPILNFKEEVIYYVGIERVINNHGK